MGDSKAVDVAVTRYVPMSGAPEQDTSEERTLAACRECKNRSMSLVGNERHSLDHPNLHVRIIWNHLMIYDLAVVSVHPDLEWSVTAMALLVSACQANPQQTRTGRRLNPRTQT